MLTSLLPGLRDLRTPLAVGYLWLCGVWLLVRGAIPLQSDATGVVAAGYALVNWLGPAPTLAVISFIAYITGAVLTLQFIPPAVRAARPNRNFLAPGENDAVVKLKSAKKFGVTKRTAGSVEFYVFTKVWQYVEQQRKEHPHWDRYFAYFISGRTEVSDAVSDFTDELMTHMKFEFDDLVRSFRFLERVQLYEDYDRKQAEADFRINVSPPLVFLIGIIAYLHGIWLLVLLVLPGVLFIQGLIRRSEARSDIYEAMAAGVTESALVNSIGRRISVRCDDARLSYDAFIKREGLEGPDEIEAPPSGASPASDD